jgi:hypothetical protein
MFRAKALGAVHPFPLPQFLAQQRGAPTGLADQQIHRHL